jgi:hypothetical protein
VTGGLAGDGRRRIAGPQPQAAVLSQGDIDGDIDTAIPHRRGRR